MRRITVPASGTSFDEAMRGAVELAVDAFTAGGVLQPFREETAEMRARVDGDEVTFGGKVTFVSDESYKVQVVDGTITRVDLPDDLLDVSVGGEVLRDAKARLDDPKDSDLAVDGGKLG